MLMLIGEGEAAVFSAKPWDRRYRSDLVESATSSHDAQVMASYRVSHPFRLTVPASGKVEWAFLDLLTFDDGYLQLSPKLLRPRLHDTVFMKRSENGMKPIRYRVNGRIRYQLSTELQYKFY